MSIDAVSPIREIAKSLHELSATLFLTLLVAGDFAFVALHVLNHKTGIAGELVWMRELLWRNLDRGYAEFYQYMKFFWVCILLTYASLRCASKHYIAWTLLFAYLLLDDSLGIHERGGTLIAAHLSFEPLFGLRRQDYGELAVTAAAGAVLLCPLVWAYRSGSPAFRRISQDLALLLSILVFFGVVVDMVHIAVKSSGNVDLVLTVIEDGGEMVSVSLILWYVFLLAVRSWDSRFFLCDLAQSILPGRWRGRATARH